MRRLAVTLFVCAAATVAGAGEKTVVSLRGMCETELKSAGFSVSQRTTIHIRARGGGGETRWSGKSNQMFAYGWIIDADTRELAWRMDQQNSEKSAADREFDGTISLGPGSYEAYFTAWGFEYSSTFTHVSMNVDRRRKPLFGNREKKKDVFGWFSGWAAEDLEKSWQERCASWGMDLLVDDRASRWVAPFTPPKEMPGVVMKATRVGDSACVRRAFVLAEPMNLTVYAIGEGIPGQELVDGAWIVDARDRRRVWSMREDCEWAGGATKNHRSVSEIDLPGGEYVLYYSSDDTHSPMDWNSEPPTDPLNWGVTIAVRDERDRKNFKAVPYQEEENVIVKLTKVRDDEHRTTGFALKKDAQVRIYALGERSNSMKQMADFGSILDARTRARVWTMDVDRTQHAGGAAKNRSIDEVITLPRGNYLVVYTTDDSHAYGSWNSDPPCDRENYGITVMGSGPTFNPAVVGKYVEEQDRALIAQISRPGNDEDRSEPFRLDRTTRVRIYAIGEGASRTMYDYAWIEEVRTGNIVWEMTYAMTFHAGGDRKNRMVSTSILLERGEYRLRWRSDDSHSYGDWNSDPPQDQQYWGVTLSRDDGAGPSVADPPMAPLPPEPGDRR